MAKGGVRISRNMLNRLVLSATADLAPGDTIDVKVLADSVGLTPEATKDVLSAMVDAGDVDKYFPPNEPGKRGRSAAVFRKMTAARSAELAEVIAAREAISRDLKDLASSNVTLRKVTVSLQDWCRYTGRDVPVDPFDTSDDEPSAE